MATVLAPIGGKIVERKILTPIDGPAQDFAKAIALGNKDEGKFPLKMRDEAIAAGFALIKSKGLVPADDSSDDVNYAEAAGVEW